MAQRQYFFYVAQTVYVYLQFWFAVTNRILLMRFHVNYPLACHYNKLESFYTLCKVGLLSIAAEISVAIDCCEQDS